MEWKALATALGKGIAAGAAGTAAMTAAQMLEMKRSGREASTMPADAVERVLPVRFESPQEKQRTSNAVHWLYGSAWGGAHGLLRFLGLPERGAALGHLALVWGTEATMLPKLGLMPSPTTWSKQELARDVGFHVVYAMATGLAYDALTRATASGTPTATARLRAQGRTKRGEASRWN